MIAPGSQPNRPGQPDTSDQVDPAENRRFWVALSRIGGIGPVRLGRLIAHFAEAPEAAWRASGQELLAAGLEPHWVEQIVAERPRLDPDAEWMGIERAGARVLMPGDAEYPARLREIHNAPPLLYIRGALLAGDDLALAVVGTRRATAYGRTVTERLVADLVAAGLTIVSGLARGIDAVAHRTALEAEGRTIAVLGSGLDIIYPGEHRALAARIAERGALLSDYPLGTQPDATNFPARNRIISGLSRGVLITEAPLASDARITVNYAVEQSREVFAVPGSILSAASATPNQLIQEGAKLVCSAADILAELNLPATTEQPRLADVLPVTPTEAALLDRLSADPQHIDDLGLATSLSAAEAGAALAMLELKGLVRQVGGQQYVLAGRRATSR